jgi:hypothetical protein
LKGIEMRLCEMIDGLNVHREELTPEMRYEIADHLTQKECVDITELLLNSLDNTHGIPGNLIWSLRDMCDQWRRSQVLTRDQKIFMSSNVIDLWHRISYLARARLYL